MASGVMGDRGIRQNASAGSTAVVNLRSRAKASLAIGFALPFDLLAKNSNADRKCKHIQYVAEHHTSSFLCVSASDDGKKSVRNETEKSVCGYTFKNSQTKYAIGHLKPHDTNRQYRAFAHLSPKTTTDRMNRLSHFPQLSSDFDIFVRSGCNTRKPVGNALS